MKYNGYITEEVADYALDLLDVDKEGLDQTDRGILLAMIEKFGMGRSDWRRLGHRSEKIRVRLRMYMSPIC